MQIVINICKDDFEEICIQARMVEDTGSLFGRIRKAISHGTPIPKWHGRLIDGDALLEPFVQHQKDYSNIAINLNFDRFKAIIEANPTIIEADRSEEE